MKRILVMVLLAILVLALMVPALAGAGPHDSSGKGCGCHRGPAGSVHTGYVASGGANGGAAVCMQCH